MPDRKTVEHLSRWKGDGVISRIDDARVLKAVQQLNLPIVDTRCAIRTPGIPSITADPTEVVRMALDHLRSKGYGHIVYCGLPGVDFSDARQRAFCRLHDAPGGSVFRHETPKPRGQTGSGVDGGGLGADAALVRWLRKLPRPVGVIASHDQRGKQVLEACAAAGLRVPYDVGVVGVDNDEVVCELADPPLTSVSPHAEAVGYDAARLLDVMMSGGHVEEGEHLVAPQYIRLRTSTDTTVVQDENLTAAISYIDRHIGEGVNVAEVAEHTALSRSSLERRFREHLGCTPREFILQRRIDRIRRLLREPNLKISDIAHRCGFRTTSHMIALFRARTGQTPSQYRRGMT